MVDKKDKGRWEYIRKIVPGWTKEVTVCEEFHMDFFIQSRGCVRGGLMEEGEDHGLGLFFLGKKRKKLDRVLKNRYRFDGPWEMYRHLGGRP